MEHFLTTVNGKWCGSHGQYFGDRCPYCPNPYPLPYQTVTVSPGSTEAAFAATVTALTQLINNLAEQLTERDRQLAEAREQIEKLTADS